MFHVLIVDMSKSNFMQILIYRAADFPMQYILLPDSANEKQSGDSSFFHSPSYSVFLLLYPHLLEAPQDEIIQNAAEKHPPYRDLFLQCFYAG